MFILQSAWGETCDSNVYSLALRLLHYCLLQENSVPFYSETDVVEEAGRAFEHQAKSHPSVAGVLSPHANNQPMHGTAAIAGLN